MGVVIFIVGVALRFAVIDFFAIDPKIGSFVIIVGAVVCVIEAFNKRG